ncbi:hypothetical protein TMatcc_000466 [Talaromyces marneffei ATCC 18224]
MLSCARGHHIVHTVAETRYYSGVNETMQTTANKVLSIISHSGCSDMDSSCLWMYDISNGQPMVG